MYTRKNSIQDDLFVEPEEQSGETSEEQDPPETEALQAGELAEQIEQVAEAAQRITRLQKDLQALQKTGLTDEDVVALLYGRNASLNKGEIESVLGALSDLESQLDQSPEDRRHLLVRLVSALNRDLTLDAVEQAIGGIEELREKYA